MNKNNLKAVILALTAVFLCLAPAAAYQFTGLSWKAGQRYDELGTKNYLPWNADELEQKYGIKTYIFKYPAGFSIEPERMARAYYNTLTRTAEDKILLIWIAQKRGEGVIMASGPVKKIVPEEYLSILQDDVLRSFLGRWYISEEKVLAKVLGAILYVIEKPGLTEEQIEAMNDRMIKIDDPLYNISLKPGFYDLIQLFYFEPISFCIYFPFVMYAFIVRMIGMNSGKKMFAFLNGIWFAFTSFVFLLIINRINILYHEYVKIFVLIMSLNAPVYLYLFFAYGDRIEAAAYSYIYNLTGGFGENNIFSNKNI
jgi:hypothetical protein